MCDSPAARGGEAGKQKRGTRYGKFRAARLQCAKLPIKIKKCVNSSRKCAKLPTYLYPPPPSPTADTFPLTLCPRILILPHGFLFSHRFHGFTQIFSSTDFLLLGFCPQNLDGTYTEGWRSAFYPTDFTDLHGFSLPRIFFSLDFVRGTYTELIRKAGAVRFSPTDFTDFHRFSLSFDIVRGTYTEHIRKAGAAYT